MRMFMSLALLTLASCAPSGGGDSAGPSASGMQRVEYVIPAGETRTFRPIPPFQGSICWEGRCAFGDIGLDDLVNGEVTFTAGQYETRVYWLEPIQ